MSMVPNCHPSERHTQSVREEEEDKHDRPELFLKIGARVRLGWDLQGISIQGARTPDPVLGACQARADFQGWEKAGGHVASQP